MLYYFSIFCAHTFKSSFTGKCNNPNTINQSQRQIRKDRIIAYLLQTKFIKCLHINSIQLVHCKDFLQHHLIQEFSCLYSETFNPNRSRARISELVTKALEQRVCTCVVRAFRSKGTQEQSELATLFSNRYIYVSVKAYYLKYYKAM